MAARPKTPGPARACRRASTLLEGKALDVLETLLDTGDDKMRLEAVKQIKEIARQAEPEAPPAQDKARESRVFVVTGIDRKPGQ
uniref:Uncharacterized protein n=1 Tax=Fundidesulfovibrio putealis TaxID=270496 RepID=A0A7C4EJS6_9BACT